MNIPKTHRIVVAGIVRDLPVMEVAPKFSIAVLNLLGDYELARAAAKALAERLPPTAEVLVMPEGKALALLQALQEETGLPAVVPRKRKTSYMLEPVLEVAAVSVTTQAEHKFYLGADDVAKLKGKDAVFLDDVISNGGTLIAIEKMLDEAGAILAGTMAIATEGAKRLDVIALVHIPVFLENA